MFTRIDHLVILAQRLEEAVETYRRLGFQVIPGGVHPGGTHNALVAFRDGSYLELIAFQRPEQPHEHRWYRFLREGGGLVDFAIGTDDLDGAVRDADQAGLGYRIVPGARRRPDGQEIEWRLGIPEASATGAYPFLIQDVTPRDLRVPSGAAADQPIGVVGVRSVVMAVRDLGEFSDVYGRLLGMTPPAAATDEALEAMTVTFPVGSQQIVLAYPTSPRSPIAAHIQQRGDGPYQAVLVAEGRDTETLLEPSDTHGARLVIVPAR